MRSLRTAATLNVMGMYIVCHYWLISISIAKSVFYRPYDNRWSKTMVGYGPESSHFVIELTYNYGVKSYEMGN